MQYNKIKFRKTMRVFLCIAVFSCVGLFSFKSNAGPNPPPADPTAAPAPENASIIENFVRPLQMMTEQLTAVAGQQVMIIGTFFDAKDQLEVQRDQQRLKARAHKDYHPDQQMCRIGSFMRSIATNEDKAVYTHLGLSDILMETYTNKLNMSSELGDESYFENKFEQFKVTYCNPNDNDAGLAPLCDHDGVAGGPTGAVNHLRRNNDIDYQRIVEFYHTLDVDFSDATAATETEQDIVALARNLYWIDAFDRIDPKNLKKNSTDYLKARQLFALSNLAHNTFAKQVSLKSSAPEPPPGVMPGWAYMKTMMRELGVDDDNIELLLGNRPSYNAQMEVLTRKMVQNPDFYTNLYTKPVNVDRINASLSAISIMQQRDLHELSMRREMLLSGMIESELMVETERVNGLILSLPSK